MDITKEKFNQLAEQWSNETGMMSLYTQKYKHPLYQEIINMGKDIIPILKEEIQKGNTEWKYALLQLNSQEF